MKWIFIVSGVVGLFLIGGIIVWIFLPGKSALSGQDTSKALKTLLGREAHLSADSPSSPMLHTSSVLQLSYPAQAVVATVDNTKALSQPGVVDSFSFSLLDDHIHGVIQAVQFSGILSEYPAVNLRLLQSDTYTPEKISDREIHFKKEDDTVERSAFILSKGKVISIAVTGYSDNKVENIFSQLLTSVKIF